MPSKYTRFDNERHKRKVLAHSITVTCGISLMCAISKRYTYSVQLLMCVPGVEVMTVKDHNMYTFIDLADFHAQ